MAKKKFINQLYRKNKSSMVTSKMLQEQSVNAILADSENRTLWINGSPYGNAYVKPDTDNKYDRLDPSNKDKYGPIHAEIFNDFDNNTAEGNYSHAEGKGTQTYNEGEHAEGKYNYSVDEQNQEFGEGEDGKSKGTISTVGIGTNDSNRKNAMRIDNNGAVYITGIQKTLADGRNVSYDPCNYEGKNLEKETKSLQEVIQGLGTMKEVTYGELRSLIDNGQLIPGMQYRIIDYASNTDTITETYKDTYKFAANQFDIIVVADSENSLNKNARACHHDFENDIKYVAENIINSDPYINDNISEDDIFSYISYENYLVYKTLTDIEKRNYSNKSQEIYNKVIEATKEIEYKKSYFDNADIESWKLQYNYNNENSWQNTTVENQKILVNVETEEGKYQIREYIYESEIENTVINNINYKYKWRLLRYQDSKKNSYDFDTTKQIINVNMYKTEGGTEIYNTYYDNILLTQLLYPSKENPGELFFGQDEKLYNIDNSDNSKLPYKIKEPLLLNISDNISGNNIEQVFLFYGETYYKGNKVYKWVKVENLNGYKNDIIGFEHTISNDYNCYNWEPKKDSKIVNEKTYYYYTYILSNDITPLKIKDNSQVFITNTNDGSFIENRYFKEYIIDLESINETNLYKAGYCEKNNNTLTAYDIITLFKKNNSINYDIHYNITEEIYEYNNKYYNVWCISDPTYYNIDPQKIIIGNLNDTNYSGYNSKNDAQNFINKLKELQVNNNYESLNSIIDKLNDALQKNKWYYISNINDDKIYFSNNCIINPSVINIINFSYENFNDYNIFRILYNGKDVSGISSFNQKIDNNNLPEKESNYKLFKYYYNLCEKNNYQNINLLTYFNISGDTDNFKVCSINNSVYIYYIYSNDNLQYFNFKYIDNTYKSQGSIEYLQDEFNNICLYDFKNIKFSYNLNTYYSGLKYYRIADNNINNTELKLCYQDNTKDSVTINLNKFFKNEKNGDEKILSYIPTFLYTFTKILISEEISDKQYLSDIVFDNSLNGTIHNNCIINNKNNNEIYKNIFVNNSLYNNKFINCSNIIFINSYLENNIFTNNDNIYNAYYVNYGENILGICPIGTFNLYDNIISESEDIYCCISTGSISGSFDIRNNKLHNYNVCNIKDKLNSATLYNYNEDKYETEPKYLSNSNNTLIDIPNIYNVKSNKNLLALNYENINIFKDDTDKEISMITNINSKHTNILSDENTNIRSNNTNIISTITTNINSENYTKNKSDWVFTKFIENLNIEGQADIEGQTVSTDITATNHLNGYKINDYKTNFPNFKDFFAYWGNDSSHVGKVREKENNPVDILHTNGTLYKSRFTRDNNTFNIKINYIDFDISSNSSIYQSIDNINISNNKTINNIYIDKTSLMQRINDLFNSNNIKNYIPSLYLESSNNFNNNHTQSFNYAFNFTYKINYEIIYLDINNKEKPETGEIEFLNDDDSSFDNSYYLEWDKYFGSSMVYYPFNKNSTSILQKLINLINGKDYIRKIKIDLNISTGNAGYHIKLGDNQYARRFKISQLYFINSNDIDSNFKDKDELGVTKKTNGNCFYILTSASWNLESSYELNHLKGINLLINPHDGKNTYSFKDKDEFFTYITDHKHLSIQSYDLVYKYSLKDISTNNSSSDIDNDNNGIYLFDNSINILKYTKNTSSQPKNIINYISLDYNIYKDNVNTQQKDINEPRIIIGEVDGEDISEKIINLSKLYGFFEKLINGEPINDDTMKQYIKQIINKKDN